MFKEFEIMKILFFFILSLSSFCFAADEDSVTITTYYPSPFGTYNELTSFSNTYLATTDSANVGIGTSSPQEKLEVAGKIMISGGGEIVNLKAENTSVTEGGPCNNASGRIVFNTAKNKLYYCSENKWKTPGGEVKLAWTPFFVDDGYGGMSRNYPIIIPSKAVHVICLAPRYDDSSNRSGTIRYGRVEYNGTTKINVVGLIPPPGVYLGGGAMWTADGGGQVTLENDVTGRFVSETMSAGCYYSYLE